jgi:spore coat protein CotH
VLAVESPVQNLFVHRSGGCHSLLVGFRSLLLGALLGALGLASAVVAAAPAADPTEKFFHPDSVQQIYLEVKPEDLDRLHRALPRRISVPGTFRWNDQSLQQVGVRYRGNSSSSPDAPHKRSFLIAFSEYQPGQRFLGLRHVALDNGIQFGSLFSERLITDALRGVGVQASRCNYARVSLNGKYQGVYVNVERIDKTFLQRQFGSDRGALFKVNEGGPGADLRYLDGDRVRHEKTFELHAGDAVKAFTGLIELMRTVSETQGSEAELRRSLDVDAFVKTTVVMLLAGAFDQYTGWNPHNYYLYRSPTEQRWTYLPWDLDVGFADRAFGHIPVLEGWHAAWPVPVPERPLMERLVAHTNLLQQYREQASVILETWFRPEVLIPKLRALHAQIRSDLVDDPYPPRRVTVPADTGYEDIVASMEVFIRKRYALARTQLDNPGKRPSPAPMPSRPDQAGPTPGPPSADAPRALRLVKVTTTSVELRWENHTDGAMAYVVQRGRGVEATDFANAIGQGGPDITTATDRDVEPRQTYRYRVYAVRPTPQGPRGTGVSNVITVRIPEP